MTPNTHITIILTPALRIEQALKAAGVDSAKISYKNRRERFCWMYQLDCQSE